MIGQREIRRAFEQSNCSIMRHEERDSGAILFILK